MDGNKQQQIEPNPPSDSQPELTFIDIRVKELP